MTLGEAAAALEGATWLRDSDIDIVTSLGGGKLPVRWEPADTVGVVRLPPGPDEAGPRAVYLRIEGQVARSELSSLLLSGRASAATEQAAVLDIGFDPPV